MHKNSFIKRSVSIALAVMLVFTLMPLTSSAAAKAPKIAKSATVAMNGTKGLKIAGKGYTIKKVISVKSSKPSVAKAKASKKNVTVYGIKAGKAKITVRVKAKKGKKTRTFKLTTRVTVYAKADRLLKKMTLEEKIAQMLMPAIRSWNGAGVTDLSKAPGLAEALRAHQYGGLILFGANIETAGQTARLTSDLQSNNAKGTDPARTDGPGVIPYLISADVEGGAVNRLSIGTRGTGSMAIGATGDRAEDNAGAIGQVFGEEMAALGINVDLAPLLDVVLDPEDHGMCNRVFSDDAETNARLGAAFAKGLEEHDVITTFKHFPGAGDGSDDPTAVQLTREALDQNGIKAYQKVIEQGMEMLMVSAVTFPKIDDLQTMADGTQGYYPASASKKIITDMLRDELGYEGVVMTDALEMQQFIYEPETGAKLFPGEDDSVEHGVAVAQACIIAGADILLIPTPETITSETFAAYYDDYIAGIATLVSAGKIKESDIDNAVRRILALKEKHGILDLDVSGAGVWDRVAKAGQVLGAPAHHAVEAETAGQAVTLLKNDDGILPISGTDTGTRRKIVFVGNNQSAGIPIRYALKQLQASGTLDPNARIVDRTGDTEETWGSEASNVEIVIARYGETAAQSIAGADLVFCISSVYSGSGALQDTSSGMQGVTNAMEAARKTGAGFVLLSAGLPTDVARFADADAIVCSYMSTGFGTNPEGQAEGSENPGAYNANLPAAIVAAFGGAAFTGKLPIDIHSMTKNEAGRWVFEDTILYHRGDAANSR